MCGTVYWWAGASAVSPCGMNGDPISWCHTQTGALPPLAGIVLFRFIHSFIHCRVRSGSRRLPSCDKEGASTRLRQWEREEPSLRKYGTDVAAAAAYLAGDKPGWMRWERRWWKRREMTVGCGQCWTGGGPCCIYSSVFTTAEHSKHWLLSGLLTASTVQEIDLIFSLYFCTVLG